MSRYDPDPFAVVAYQETLVGAINEELERRGITARVDLIPDMDSPSGSAIGLCTWSTGGGDGIRDGEYTRPVTVRIPASSVEEAVEAVIQAIR